MSRRHISQREAHSLAKRVAELENEREEQRSRWARGYPGGINLGTLTLERTWLFGRVEAARMLNHAVILTTQDDGKINLYALPQSKP